MKSNASPIKPLVMRVDLPEQRPAHEDKDAARPMLELLDDVKVKVDIHLGCAELTVKDLMGLRVGSVIELDRHLGDTIDVLLNARMIAQAEIVAVGEQFGIRITNIPGKQ
ncbi:flagellar motor switch protein FliN [Paraburkholderia sp. GAS82]|uniref:flagellar motor switch protein FliN n=1 Tax=Paraburkholderia sp. GAS82 TaxID=3035137 RepID=UPI003D231F44